METFLVIIKTNIFIGVVCSIASPVVAFFVLKNNQKLAAWVFSKLIKPSNKA